MAYTGSKKGTAQPNFLARGEDIWPVTRTIPTSFGDTAGDRKIARAGKIFPANDSTAVGILFEDVDVTDGPHAGSVMIAGGVYADRLPEKPVSAAQSAMEKTGLVFLAAAPTITRP